MTVTALLDITVKTEALAEAAAVIHETLTATRARPGNLGVEVLTDSAVPTHFVIVEKWATIEDDNAYRAWRATPDGASDLGTILGGAPTLTFFTTAEGV